MKDLPSIVSIGFPIGSLLFCTVIAMIDTAVYERYISMHESGYLEYSTVIFLFPAVIAAIWIFFHREYLPARWLGGWALLLGLGSLYFLGEEVSWGQHIFGWATPDWWTAVNDQGETNIHNTSGLFDQTPRFFLTCGTIVAIFAPLLLWKRRKQWNPSTSWQEWFWPTMACIPAAVIAALVGIPQKFYRFYGEEKEEHIWAWFDSLFLRGNHSELKEHFLALFIFVYVGSFFYRYRQIIREQKDMKRSEITGS